MHFQDNFTAVFVLGHTVVGFVGLFDGIDRVDNRLDGSGEQKGPKLRHKSRFYFDLPFTSIVTKAIIYAIQFVSKPLFAWCKV